MTPLFVVARTKPKQTLMGRTETSFSGWMDKQNVLIHSMGYYSATKQTNCWYIQQLGWISAVLGWVLIRLFVSICMTVSKRKQKNPILFDLKLYFKEFFPKEIKTYSFKMLIRAKIGIIQNVFYQGSR